MTTKQKEAIIRGMIYKALDDVTSEDAIINAVDIEWSDNLVSLMTDAAVAVLLAAEEMFNSQHVPE